MSQGELKHSRRSTVIASLVSSDPHRKKAVDKIRRLFIRMGMDRENIQTRGSTEQGPDLIIDYRVPRGKQIVGARMTRKRVIRILVQCKHSDAPSTDYLKLNDLIRVYESYVRETKADVALITLEGYNIPDTYKTSTNIERVRTKSKVVYWDDEAIEHYRKTAHALGKPFTLYTFLNDLGFRIRLANKPLIVGAQCIRQHFGGDPMWVFSISAEKLLPIAYVSRRGSVSPEAYQRLLSSHRIGQVAEFVQKSDSMLVNNIVIALEEPFQHTNGHLEIPQITCSAWIIDGQHRLYGFARLLGKPESKTLLRDFQLIVVAIRGGRKGKARLIQAKLFREINEFQQKIERNLLLDLYHYLHIDDEEGMLERIDVAKRLSKTEPFKGRLRIRKTQKGHVTLATLVDYKRFTQIAELHGRSTYRICKSYFELVSEIFSGEWTDTKNYVLCTNKGVRMLISLLSRILDHLEREGNKPTSGRIGSYLKVLKKIADQEPDLLRSSTYVGKALGAGAPDLVSTSMWAARIHDVKRDFLTPAELKDIMAGDVHALEELEDTLRKCLKEALGAGYFVKLPKVIRDQAVREKVRELKTLPWRKQTDPIETYLSFADYRSVITSKKRWDAYFKSLFLEKSWIATRLMELEPIRNRLQHFRQLDSLEKSKLALYKKEIQTAFEKWHDAKKTASPASTQSP